MFAPGLLRQPKATQIVYIRIRQLVDKYAHVDFYTGVISYTEKTNPKLIRTIDKDEAWRIFSELYIEV